MSYKLLEVTSLYPKYIDYFYSKNPNVENLSYKELYNLIMDDCFAECDFLHKELNKLGIETQLIYFNDDKLQRRWNPDFQNSSPFDIFIAQLKAFKPDVIYVSDIPTFTSEQYKIIRDVVGEKVKLVGWHFTVVANEHIALLKQFDEIYTGNKYILGLLENVCKSTKLVYHAFSPSVLEKVTANNLCQIKNNTLLFSGSIFLGEEIHNNRLDMLGELSKHNIDYDFFGNIYGSLLPRNPLRFAKWLLNGRLPSLSRLKIEKLLRTKVQSSVFGLDYYTTISQHTICINQHAKIAGTGSGNMRMFEVTGIGSCLLTDYRKENIDLFIPNEEIVVYNNYDDFVEKGKWLINHPREAYEIGLRGQQKTLRNYTYKNKAEIINDNIVNLLK